MINNIKLSFACIKEFTLFFFLLFVLSCTSEKESNLLISCDNSDLVIEVIENNAVTCSHQGSITVVASGGASSYLFSIDSENFQTNPAFSDLLNGEYTITVKDKNDCVATVNTTIDLSDDAISLTTSNITSASCGSSNASVSLVASGGIAPYTFKIGNGSYQDSPLFDGLAAGDYVFNAMDGSGCLSQLSVTIMNDESDLFIVINSTSAAGCGTSTGAISLSATGGNGTYNYQLNNGSFSTISSFSGLASGSYSVAVSDGNDCTDAKTVELLSGIKLATQIMPIISANCAVSGCHNGSQNPNLSTNAQIITHASSIKNRTANRSMPIGGRTLTNAQIANIACWVDDGALDN